MHDMRTGLCPLCNHNEIIESEAADFCEQGLEKPQAVTYDPRWIMPGRNPAHPHGHLKMYVCRGCGYVQWFADDPQSIPIEEQYKTRLIKGRDPGLYR